MGTIARYYNREHYADPTAWEVERRFEFGNKKKRSKRDKESITMGGRGGSGISYSSADKVLIKEKPLEVERMTNLSDSGNVVLSAKTDGKGNLVLGYPETLGYRKQNSKTTYAQHKIEHGMTNTTATGKRMNLTSVGINWDKVNSVSGKTYGTQHFMRERGFTWNGAKKIWERKK